MRYINQFYIDHTPTEDEIRLAKEKGIKLKGTHHFDPFHGPVPDPSPKTTGIIVVDAQAFARCLAHGYTRIGVFDYSPTEATCLHVWEFIPGHYGRAAGVTVLHTKSYTNEQIVHNILHCREDGPSDSE